MIDLTSVLPSDVFKVQSGYEDEYWQSNDQLWLVTRCESVRENYGIAPKSEIIPNPNCDSTSISEIDSV
ncbi:hypothetical protein AVEN_53614-1 [Araneus ventricosus]|uniref:Uncharacterized protein n=1 Tax=Araneus ventricosus TaxID=182803 RepID=A0A4Y2UM64_ARAVE|nr:hypothetical protein AVEN_53614-1 [Araneus ventricosus]